MINQEYLQSRLASLSLPDSLDTYVYPDYGTRPTKNAAVLIPLFSNGAGWEIIFTKRTDKVETHKGQISFPGGARENNDMDLMDTALRETYEEIGVKIPRSSILGKLNTRKTISNYLVTSFVAITPPESVFQINAEEVERILSIPLTWLSEPDNLRTSIHPESNSKIYQFSPYNNEVIWGVTAGILFDFLKIFED